MKSLLPKLSSLFFIILMIVAFIPIDSMTLSNNNSHKLNDNTQVNDGDHNSNRVFKSVQSEDSGDEVSKNKNIQKITSEDDTKELVEEDYYLPTTGDLIIRAINQGEFIDTKIKVFEVPMSESISLVTELSSDNREIIIPLEPGDYLVEVGDLKTVTSEIYSIRTQMTYEFNTQLSLIEFSPYSFDNTDSEEVDVLDENNEVLWSGVVTSDEDLKLYGQGGEYRLYHHQLNKIYNFDVGEHGVFPVLMTENRFNFKVNSVSQTGGIGIDQTASFGQLRVYMDTFDNMPLYFASVQIINGSDSSGDVITTIHTGTDGFASLDLAPENYTLRAYKGSFDEIAFESTNNFIIGGEELWSNNTFNLIRFWDENDTNSVAYIYDENTYLGYHSTDSYNKIDIWAPTYDMTFTFDGNWYNISVTTGEFVEVNNRTEFAPIFYNGGTTFNENSPTGVNPVQIEKRVGSNDQSNITIEFFDRNFDFPITTSYTPNVGSITSSTIKYLRYGYMGETVTYNSPGTSGLFFVDISIEDAAGLNDSYRVYLSNRTVSIEVRSMYNNSLPENTRVWLYSGTDLYQYIQYTDLGGDGTYTWNIFEGEYYLIANEQNQIRFNNRLFNGSIGSYILEAKWNYLALNVTREYGKSVGASIQGINSTDPGNNGFSFSVSSSGLGGFLVAPYTNYDIRATASPNGVTPIIKYNQSLTENVISNIDIQFGTLAVYLFNSGNPQNTRVWIYNGTALAEGDNYLNYQDSGGDGISLFYLAPYDNYTVYFVDGVGTWIIDIEIIENEALAVHEFTNSAPIISDIDASPRRIGPSENTTITVMALDIDSIDLLDYTWESNVGTIQGTGSSIVYIAPASVNYYRIDVNVTDQFGGLDQIHIYVSNNTAKITVNSTTYSGTPLSQRYYLYENYPEEYKGYQTTNSSGLTTFTIYDGEYRFESTGTTLWIQNFFVYANDSYLHFQWGNIIANTTTANGTHFNGYVRVYNSDQTENEASLYVGNDGLANLTLRPDTYDIFAQGNGDGFWIDDYVVGENVDETIDLKFAQLAFEINTASNNPRNMRTYLYISDGIGSYNYKTYSDPGIDGYSFFNLAPGNYSLQYNSLPSNSVTNIILTDNEYHLQELDLGRMMVYANNGTDPMNYLVTVYEAGSGSYFANAYTGVDGLYELDIVPGLYDVTINGMLYQDIEVTALNRTEVGFRINNFDPSINSISKTVNYIGPSSQSNITLDVSDLNYDYDNFTLSIDTTVGSITNLNYMDHFISTNEYRIAFTYNSPGGSIDVYRINVTLFDSYGGSDSYIIFLSDQDNTVNLFSEAGNQLPENTHIQIRDVESNSVVVSSSLGTDGYGQYIVKDGWYNIHFDEFTDINMYRVEIYGNIIYNLTASFATVDIYSTGLGGAPLSSRVYVYNKTTDPDTYLGYGDTSGTTGLYRFILAPGDYRFVVDEATDIILNAEVEGGTNVILGSEVPNLANNPESLIFYYGQTNQILSWQFSDENNPDTYKVTLNNSDYVSDTWDGSTVTVNFDGLNIGVYNLRIEVNDTYGFENYDLATITVLEPPVPSISDVADIELAFNTSTQLGWIVNSYSPDQYYVYVNDVLVDTGYWFSGNTITYSLETPLEGIYNLTVLITDDFGKSVKDQSIITVGADPIPDIVDNGNISLSVGYDSEIIEFITNDNNPNYYEIRIDGELILTDDLVTGINSFSLDEYGVGTYTISITVYDHSDQFFSTSVELEVFDDLVPFLSNLQDQTIEYGDSPLALNWTISDNTQIEITLYQDGQIVETRGLSNNWWVYEPEINDIGVYNITLYIEDEGGNSKVDTVFLTIEDTTSPVITNSGNQTLVIGEEALSLNWEITELSEFNFQLYYQDHELFSGESTNSFTYEIIQNITEIGDYSFLLTVTDIWGNQANSTILITRLADNLVFIETPVDITLDQVSLSQANITWSAMSYSPDSFEIFINGSVISTNTWTNGTVYSIDLSDYTEFSLLNVTIVVSNSIGEQITHSFYVIIEAEDEGTLFSDLSNVQLALIAVIALAILIAIFRFGDNTSRAYGRVF